MKELIVIASCSKRAGLLDILERQLAGAGIDFYVNPIDAGLPWVQLSSMARRLSETERLLDQFGEYDRFIFIDGWDMLFFGSKEETTLKVPSSYVLMAAERNPFPDSSVADAIPDHGLPWRFANGGGLCGTAESLMEWISEFRRWADYDPGELDQAIFNKALAARAPLFSIDNPTRLFYCMYQEDGELVHKPGSSRPMNSLTEQNPCFIHFNGHADPAGFLREYGIG